MNAKWLTQKLSIVNKVYYLMQIEFLWSRAFGWVVFRINALFLAITFIAHFVNLNTEHHFKPYDPFSPMWMGISSRRLHNINFNGIKMVTLNRITIWVDLHNKLKPKFDSNQKATTTSTSPLESLFFSLVAAFGYIRTETKANDVLMNFCV